MTYRLIWHGPVADVEYDVDALSWDDAGYTLIAWLNGNEEMEELVRKV